MMKKEALEFLELLESASPGEIKMRIADRLAYFENLTESTPSEFLKRVYSKKKEALKEMEIDSLNWEPYDVELATPKQDAVQPEPEPVLADELSLVTIPSE